MNQELLWQFFFSQVVESQSDLITNCSWLVKISKEAFDKSRIENNGTAFVGVLRFKNMRNKVLHASILFSCMERFQINLLLGKRFSISNSHTHLYLIHDCSLGF